MPPKELLEQSQSSISAGRTRWRIPCPACSPARKKQNRNTPVLVCDLATDPARILYHCHHCDAGGAVLMDGGHWESDPSERSAPQTPAPDDPVLWEAHAAYLASRGISEKAARILGVYSANKYFRAEGSEQDCMAFPYFNEKGKVVATKYRTVDKEFTQDAGGQQILFGLQQEFDYGDYLTICEGEIDALSFIEAGIQNVVSVPGGAPSKVGEAHGRFAFLETSEAFLRKFPKGYILCVDTDGPGLALRDELARRLGKARCFLLTLPEDCKDANDVIRKHSRYALIKAHSELEPYPISALHSATHYRDAVKELRTYGSGRGLSTGMETVDELFTIQTGQLSVVTGVPSSGKSNFLDQIMVNMAQIHDWKFALCSFENEPKYHITKLAEMYMGKRFWGGPASAMSDEELDVALDFVDAHFNFIDFAENLDAPTLEVVLEKAQSAVMRSGIRGLVIDPYNYIEIDKNLENETEFISRMLTRIRRFAVANDVHVWFVAHPAKMPREGGKQIIPKGYEISGSAHWFNKTDVGITVHREDELGIVEIHTWKCRFKWIGKQGKVALKYDIPTGRYLEMNQLEDRRPEWAQNGKGWS